jgi:hypothetical protein
MASSTASKKAKGRKFQQKVRDSIISLDIDNLTLDDVRSTGMGQGGEDIQLSPKAREVFPYSVECKKHKSFAIYKHYEQAEANCPRVMNIRGIEPVLFIEGDYKRPLAVIDMEHFIDLVYTCNLYKEKTR